MAANLRGTEKLLRKRIREDGQEEYGAKKRRKDEKGELLKEGISIQTYFSLRSEESVNESQLKIWLDFKTLVKECFPFENKDLDDNTLFVYVPQSVLPALERIDYKEINLDTLKTTLEKWANFIETLSQLNHSSKIDEECEELFMQLNLYIEEEDIDLTLTEPAGWNVLHIAAFHGRVALLIGIQQQLLPEKLEQYKRLLCAETNRAKAKPASIKKARHHKEFAILLSEESPLSLKEKQFTAMLKMWVAHGEEPQCATFYEQLKQFIAEGVDPTVTQNIIGWTILHAAVHKGDIELVKHILQHASLKQCEVLLSAKTQQKKESATDIAERKKFEEITSILEEKKRFIALFKEELIALFKDLKELSKSTDKQALYERIKQIINKNGGDPAVTSENGLNFLHYAAHARDITLVRLVMKYVKTEQEYQVLLNAKSTNKGVTPYDLVKRKKKNPENEQLIALLNPDVGHNISPSSQHPEVDQSISQSSQQSFGQVPFFSHPTLLSGDQELSQAKSSLTM